MCGIAGILRISPTGSTPPPPEIAIPEAWLDLLDASVRHRGPDGQGRFRDRVVRADGATADIALVHRRLSILDHATGDQPMLVTAVASAPARTVQQPGRSPRLFHGPPGAPVSYNSLPPDHAALAVTFNGCIYNHGDLRRELTAAGRQFTTDHSDTEVIPHAWRRWGTECIERLEGMYAAAIWDGASGDLILLRDPFGEKPLYYTSVKSEGALVVAFSSSFAGLVHLEAHLPEDQEQEADSRDLQAWIQFGWNQRTPHPRIQEASHGGVQVFAGSGESNTFNSRWSNVLPGGHDAPSHRSAAELDPILRRAVHDRLDADVPLGCFLSGGIDSALITKYASEVRPDLTAFTVRMPAPEYDESAAAAATARALGVRHEILDCHPDPAADLVSAIEQLGLPFGDSSLLPSLWVNRAARSRVTVALGGDGGDELFLGYERHAAARWLFAAARLNPAMLNDLAGAIDLPNPRSRRSKAARFLRAAAANGYKDLVSIFPPHLAAQLWPGAEISDTTTGRGHFGMVPRGAGRSFTEHFDLVRRFDLMFYLPLDLLRKADTASMSVALELRAPMLDRHVVDFGLGASRRSLMPRGRRKGLLRDLARRYLPDSVVDRPKMGFAIPIGDWFRTDWGGMRTLLMDTLNSTNPFPADVLGGLELNRGFIRQLAREHQEGTRDHSQRLYMLLVLAIWCRWRRRSS